MKITEHNVESGEIVERDMTDDELAQFEADKEAAEKAAEEKVAKATARQALLDRLGITEEEAKLLLS